MQSNLDLIDVTIELSDRLAPRSQNALELCLRARHAGALPLTRWEEYLTYSFVRSWLGLRLGLTESCDASMVHTEFLTGSCYTMCYTHLATRHTTLLYHTASLCHLVLQTVALLSPIWICPVTLSRPVVDHLEPRVRRIERRGGLLGARKLAPVGMDHVSHPLVGLLEDVGVVSRET
jgi:hypothetical protein